MHTTCSSSVLEVSSGIVSGNSLSFASRPICAGERKNKQTSQLSYVCSLNRRQCYIEV